MVQAGSRHTGVNAVTTSSEGRVSRRRSRRGIGGNNPPVFTVDECLHLADEAFGEVAQIEKLTQVSVQHMAAAVMGYHQNMSDAPELGYYVTPNQDKSRNLIWTTMYDFFMPKEKRVKLPTNPDLQAERAFEAQRRNYALLQRGTELAAWIARCHLSLESYKADEGMWEIPLTFFASEGYKPAADDDSMSALMDGTRWLAIRPAKKATKTSPAVPLDIERWFASTTRFVETQIKKHAPKPVTPTIVPSTATPTNGTPISGGAPVTPPVAGAPNAPVNAPSVDNREPRLPATEAATQTIAGWCNAVIKTLRQTSDGKLAYRTLKDLADQDREALVMLVKIYDEMVKLAADAKAKPTMRVEKIAA
jgi:hypothetical protein